MANLKYDPMPKPEPDQEPRPIVYGDIAWEKGFTGDRGKVFWGDHWSPIWELWKTAPWEKEPDQDQVVHCVICKMQVRNDAVFEHVEEHHPVSRIRCPLCERFLYPCEFRKHFYGEHSMDIRGRALTEDDKARDIQPVCTPDREKGLTEIILKARADKSYTLWTPFREAWNLYSWPDIRKLPWRFECPSCRKLIRPADIYRHVFAEHAALKDVECFLCGEKLLGGMLDYHFECEHESTLITEEE